MLQMRTKAAGATNVVNAVETTYPDQRQTKWEQDAIQSRGRDPTRQQGESFKGGSALNTDYVVRPYPVAFAPSLMGTLVSALLRQAFVLGDDGAPFEPP